MPDLPKSIVNRNAVATCLSIFGLWLRAPGPFDATFWCTGNQIADYMLNVAEFIPYVFRVVK